MTPTHLVLYKLFAMTLAGSHMVGCFPRCQAMFFTRGVSLLPKIYTYIANYR